MMQLNGRKLDSGQEADNTQRRAFIRGSLAALAASPLLAASRRVAAQQNDQGHDEQTRTPNDPFILLLNGIYQPVPANKAPDLGLQSTGVDLRAGYTVTKIYPVFGIGNENDAIDQHTAIGNFYAANTGPLVAYQLPGGAIAMSFNPVPPGISQDLSVQLGYNNFNANTTTGVSPFPDGKGGYFWNATFELEIIGATGVYRSFLGGHNHMVDHLHFLAGGQLDEFCFCNISTYKFPYNVADITL